jgi:hypothetical protein
VSYTAVSWNILVEAEEIFDYQKLNKHYWSQTAKFRKDILILVYTTTNIPPAV